jgi:cytochrome c oxidase cbb3-type subunit 3
MRDPQILEHDYDGIREYDNPLPGWWKFLFLISVVFSAWYVVYYHWGNGESVQAQYDREMLELYDLQAKEILKLGPITDETIAKIGLQADVIAGARGLFAQRCAVCHGVAGQGGIGPNLTDAYWLHGGKPIDIHRTIGDGVPAKGMVAWKAQLPAGQILALSSYVVSLQGTNPPGAKAPQGTLVP